MGATYWMVLSAWWAVALFVLGVVILQVGFGRFAECDGYNPQLCKSE